MANINRIRVSGTTYDIQDINAPKVIELTQAEYDALTVKDPNAFYVITDSEYNFDGYWTSAQTQNAITQSVSSKADTSAVTSVSESLTAHTANTTVHVTAQDKTNWNNKSDFSGSYNDLTDKPTIPTVPTNVSDFTNDAGYITSSALDGYATTGDVQTATADMATKTWVGQQGYLTEHQDISGKQDVSGMTAYTKTSAFAAHTASTTVHVTANEKATWNAKSDFSGDYNDLDNKPTIPTSASQLTNDSGYITSSALNGYATEDYVTAATNDMATKTWVGQQGYLTEHQSLSNYYTKSETSGATQISTALASKQSTLESGINIKTINNESILGSGNIDIQGGGKAIEAGRGISITTGETADTVSFNLPISAGTNSSNLIIAGERCVSNGNKSIATGSYTKAQQSNAFAQGYQTDAGQEQSHAEGYQTKAYGVNSHSEGRGTSAMTLGSHAEGLNTITSNSYEHSQGWYNVSSSASTTFGDSGNTLFSVGNGTSTSARHNAFEIRQNGDIYLNNGTSDVKLQEYLQIKAVKLTQAEYDALVTKDSNTLYVING